MKKLTCHCGEVEAEIIVPKKLDKILRCNCSFCKRRGAIMSMVKNEQFKIIKGEKKLRIYQFHTKVAKHFFCNVCGVYTHHVRRRDPSQISINIMCVDDILIPTETKINLIDGASHD